MFTNNSLFALNKKATTPITKTKKGNSRNDNDDDDDHNDDDDDDDDLSGALRDMDIDRDFNALRSNSTTSSTAPSSHLKETRVDRRGVEIDGDHNDNDDDEKDRLMYKARLQRDQVFSANYTPTAAEEKELEQLVESLGVGHLHPNYHRSNPLSSVSHLVTSALSPLASPVAAVVTAAASVATGTPTTTTSNNLAATMEQVLRVLLFENPTSEQQSPNNSNSSSNLGRSIILKRGPVIYQPNHEARELVILTHGFLLLSLTSDSDQNMSGCCTTNSTSSLPSASSSSSSTPAWIVTSLPKLPSWNPTAAATSKGTNSNSNTAQGQPTFTIEAAHVWKDVTMVQAKSQTDASDPRRSFGIQINGHPVVYTLSCKHHAQQQAWLDALETVVIQAYNRFLVPSHKVAKDGNDDDGDDEENEDDDDDEDDTWSLGWQHRIIQRSLHSPAFTGDVHVLRQMLGSLSSSSSSSSSSRRSQMLDQLDIYQAWTPLHYAAYHNHVSIAKLLLEAGANPNIAEGTTTNNKNNTKKTSSSSSSSSHKSSNGGGRTPLYFAERYRFAEMKKVLESHGARSSSLARTEERGALFRSVATVEEQKKHAKEKAKKEQAAAAAAAASRQRQRHGLQSLQERGQRIDALDQKTQELEQNANEYRDMAKTLKDQTMQKKWYQM